MLHAVVTAGFNPEKPDLLAESVGVSQKALIDVAGRPLVWWTVKALRDSGVVDRIVVVGIEPDLQVDLGANVVHLPNRPDPLENIVQGVDYLTGQDPDMDYAVLASGDVPLLRPKTVRWFVDVCLQGDYDFYYPIVQDQVMESQFPGAGRSYLRIREGRFCGGDLSLFRMSVLQANLELIRRLFAERKRPLRQAKMFGWKTLLKVALGQLTISEGEAVIGRLLNCRVRAVVAPHADLAMDVDKPHQLDMVRKLLAARAGA
ncbi:MAG: nucleotidyltransferase family protein [Anaerolineae bacterium]|nr:nucleotidyltransferase family protein [Anaerolineae bacterium]